MTGEALISQALRDIQPALGRIDEIAYRNQKKVLEGFRALRVSDSHFAPTTGYGYNDRGRDDLERLWAHIFGCEAALVRHSIVSGTHALTIGLFGLLRPGDILLSVTGKPYDTLEQVIGLSGEGNGSLRDFGVVYAQNELKNDGTIDFAALEHEVRRLKPRVVYIQRSRGYSARPALSAAETAKAVEMAKRCNSDCDVMIDNCYCEFVEEIEPTQVGADLVVGSLIKNPGGGIADSGGYLCGTARAVELAACRMTSPGVGAEVGASLGQSRNMYRGLFMAPHTVVQALKTAVFAARVFELAGFEVSPAYGEERYDIIQSIRLGHPELVKAFCRGIQAASPVDSFATPEPWDMPGYQHQVIMAAGAFTQGASIELSADAPMREPYDVFLQGGLTFESGRLGVAGALESVLEAMRSQSRIDR